MIMKRATPINTITYMALMAALNILFALLASFVPLAGLFLVIALPLTSALVAINCDIRYYPIYFVATLGLSLLVTMQQIETTIFYIFPSLILGLAFGWLIKIKGHDILILIITSIVQLALLYVTIWLINGLFQIDFLNSLKLVLHLDAELHINTIMPAILYVISLAQTTLTYIVISPEINKMAIKHQPNAFLNIYVYLAALLLSLIIVPLGLWIPSISYMLLGPLFMVTGTSLYEFIQQQKFKPLIIASGWLIITTFLVAILFPLLDPVVSILLVTMFPFGVIILRIIDFYLPKFITRYKMKPRGRQ
ncbi:MAG TPA: hypothetical protein DCX17_02120 [Firmicutes bacterium]|jgi:hypothetical protein|nr:hypothetical protein [Bacillota bacterium]